MNRTENITFTSKLKGCKKMLKDLYGDTAKRSAHKTFKIQMKLVKGGAAKQTSSKLGKNEDWQQAQIQC